MSRKENVFFMDTNPLNNLVRVAVICVVLFFALLGLGLAGQSTSLSEVALNLKTPQALAAWLSSDFRYEFVVGDGWEDPQEVIRLKKGDCDDFAVLSRAILQEMGIISDIVILKYKGLSIAHAVCVWKDARGKVSFISNQKLYQTDDSDIRQALLRFYPDLETIIYADKNLRYTRLVKAR